MFRIIIEGRDPNSRVGDAMEWINSVLETIAPSTATKVDISEVFEDPLDDTAKTYASIHIAPQEEKTDE